MTAIATTASLNLVAAGGWLSARACVPAGHMGFLIRDDLACDILQAGRHRLARGDRVLLAPASPWDIDSTLDDGRQVRCTVAMLRATYHGSDCFGHFFGPATTATQADPAALIAELLRERSGRLDDCQAELRRLLIPVGLELVSMVVTAQVQPVAADDADGADPAPASLVPSTAQASEPGAAAEQALHVRLGLVPELQRHWWRRERLPAFEQRVLDTTRRHLDLLQRDLSELRSQGRLPRAQIQAIWDLVDALNARIQAQRPAQVSAAQADRGAMVEQSRGLLSICEQLIARPIAAETDLERVANGLEELRRALDRRSHLLTGV